ncbi:TadG family pilus assembly protein [Paraburkholderia sp. J41]|uniref:TadG family pilus assembly protein n=1 Tax=Paraburkholderia sp. J41 TaxID=2805433 RepID=UPI002AC346E8|nr:TadG family pilus assembly protein [Paraburkholderia sp. J41]
MSGPARTLFPHSRRGSRASLRRRAQGSIAVMATLAIVLAVAALGVLDLANLYSARRSLQNVADLAALAAAQQMDDSCAQPTATATANAATNGFVAQAGTRSLSVVCGRWDQSGQQAANPPAMSFTPNGATPWNGVAVMATNTVPYFFAGPARTISASATAQATVVGAFSLATTLVQANLLNGLLSSLLGTSVKLDLVSWNGIANANIKVADLAAVATDAGTVDGLLDAQANVSRIATLVASAVQNDGALTADVQAAVAGLNLAATAAAKQDTKIALASRTGAPALLSLGLANAQSAANATVNALQMLIVAAEIAQAGKPPVSVQLDLTQWPALSSVLSAGVSLGVNVLSPPTIAVGEAGPNPPNPPPWRTEAHNAQIVVQLTLDLGKTSLVGLVGDVQLPLYVEVAQATAGLDSAQCAPTREDSRMAITVQPGIANLCVGTPGTPATLTEGQCSGSAAPILSVVGSTLAVNGSLSLPLVSPQTAHLTFDGNGAALDGNSANTNAIGGALANGLASAVNQLSQGTLQVTLFGQPVSLAKPLNLLGLGSLLGLLGIGKTVNDLVSGVLNTVLTALSGTVLNALDTLVIEPLLQLLGVQAGVADVSAFALTCGVAQLVQ